MWRLWLSALAKYFQEPRNNFTRNFEAEFGSKQDTTTWEVQYYHSFKNLYYVLKETESSGFLTYVLIKYRV